MKPVMRDQAETFRKLHQGPELLVLPNAWDVATARLVEEAGFPAIATTSAGIAWALGYADGERIFFFSSRRRHTRCLSDWSSDVCSSDLSEPGRLVDQLVAGGAAALQGGV